MQTHQIYVDLDGVLADYETQYRKLTGGEPSERGHIKSQRLRAHPRFYRHLELLPGALDLWRFLEPHHPNILSAQSNFVPNSRSDKKEWVEQHLGLTGERVIIVDYPRDKRTYARPNAILIDDNAKVCQEWRESGGIAIHHRTAERTIEKLKELLKEN